MKKNDNLDGNAPDSCPVALLIIDMINDLEFPEGPQLLAPAMAAAKHIADLKRRAKKRHIPVIYVNDNFGHWRSDFRQVVENCLQNNVHGRPLAQLLQPEPDDYFVLKPKNSAFYATPLALLLTYLNVERLILTGISADVCVLFSAQDAYLRDLKLNIPSDCIASHLPEHVESSLAYMKRVLAADTTPSTALDLSDLVPQPMEQAFDRN